MLGNVRVYAAMCVVAVTAMLVGLEPRSTLLAANCSTACTAGWITISDIAGGVECEHGPEHDADCRALACYPNCNWGNECWELNGNMGDCKCFECGLAGGCEGDIRHWRAQCGKKTAENDGDCPINNGANGVIRQQRGASVPGGGACNSGANGYILVEYCGGGVGQSQACSCVSSNCAGNGNWTDITNGPRQACGP